jgi:hypothetical protein
MIRKDSLDTHISIEDLVEYLVGGWSRGNKNEAIKARIQWVGGWFDQLCVWWHINRQVTARICIIALCGWSIISCAYCL